MKNIEMKRVQTTSIGNKWAEQSRNNRKKEEHILKNKEGYAQRYVLNKKKDITNSFGQRSRVNAFISRLSR